MVFLPNNVGLGKVKVRTILHLTCLYLAVSYITLEEQVYFSHLCNVPLGVNGRCGIYFILYRVFKTEFPYLFMPVLSEM
jgi:hypothetical protein